MDDFTRAAAETALRRMFRSDGFLDICTVDKLIKVTGCVPPASEYQAVSLLHCVSWKEMSQEVRAEAARRIVGWFALPAFDPWPVEQSTTTASRLDRLLGRAK